MHKIYFILALLLLTGFLSHQAFSQGENARHEITELYRHILGREPDVEGLKYWVVRYNHGMSLESIKQAFYNSEEYHNLQSGKTAGPNPNHDINYAKEQITGFYRNILGREPEAEGYQYWVQRYIDGMTLEQIEGAFYASPEYQQRRVGMKTGYEGVNKNTAPRELIVNFYRQLLGREPSENELSHYLKEYKEGIYLEDIRQQILRIQKQDIPR